MLNDEDKIFVARYVAGAVSTEEIFHFADSKLNSGVYSDYFLEIIDDELQYSESVRPNFEAAILEMKGEIPDFEEAILQVIRFHLQLISDGNVEPFSQIRKMLDDIDEFDLGKNIIKYVGDNVGIEHLYGMYYAKDDLNDSNYDVQMERIRKEMCVESTKWLKEH
jgi:hypothetical protein